MKLSIYEKSVDRAVEIFRKEFGKAVRLPGIRKPIAWALYQTFLIVDAQEPERPMRAEAFLKEGADNEMDPD